MKTRAVGKKCVLNSPLGLSFWLSHCLHQAWSSSDLPSYLTPEYWMLPPDFTVSVLQSCNGHFQCHDWDRPALRSLCLLLLYNSNTAQCVEGLYELFKFLMTPPIDINISVLQNKNWSSKKVSYLFKKYSGKGVDLVFKTSSLISNPCVWFFPYCFPTFHQRESSGSIPASPMGSFLFLIHYHSVFCVAEDPSSCIPKDWEQKWITKRAWPLILYSSISIAT